MLKMSLAQSEFVLRSHKIQAQLLTFLKNAPQQFSSDTMVKLEGMVK